MSILEEKLEKFLWGDTILSMKDISAIGYGYRNGWKDALEEALKYETDLQSTELGDWIRKELEDK